MLDRRTRGGKAFSAVREQGTPSATWSRNAVPDAAEKSLLALLVGPLIIASYFRAVCHYLKLTYLLEFRRNQEIN